MISLEEVKNNKEVQELIVGSQAQLNVLGYTEHSIRHINIVSTRAGNVLKVLRLSRRKNRTSENFRIFA